MQYHASLITADGAYHCPMGSIMPIFAVIRAEAMFAKLYIFNSGDIKNIQTRSMFSLHKEQYYRFPNCKWLKPYKITFESIIFLTVIPGNQRLNHV